MKHIKTFEKLGIDKIVINISDKIWKNFLNIYNSKKVFKNESDNFYTNVSEFKIKNLDKIGVNINYNEALSKGGFIIDVGVIDRNDNTKPKDLDTLKQEIYHEVQHLIYALRKYGKIKDIKSFKSNEKQFLFSLGVTNFIEKFIINAFRNRDGNLYGQKVSIQNFLNYNKLSEAFKKLVVYLYLSNEDELSSRVQEFFVKAKKPDYINNMKNDHNYKMYKNLINFEMNVNDFTKDELNDIDKGLFKLKNMKKVQKYINMKGEKFVKKVHKLSYFQNPDNNLED